jgi:hypothetical protein
MREKLYITMFNDGTNNINIHIAVKQDRGDNIDCAVSLGNVPAAESLPFSKT